MGIVDVKCKHVGCYTNQIGVADLKAQLPILHSVFLERSNVFYCPPLCLSSSLFSRYNLQNKLYSMGWGNICKRRMKVFALAVVIYLDYKALQQREKWISKTKRASLWEKAHERNAKRVLHLIVELEGLWVKLGQYLSTRADVLPPAYIDHLKKLQDSLPPRPLEEVCRTIERELGKSMHDLFLNFEDTALATASIAQVHRATLSDGQEVVVKVQHDGIKEVILEDLKNAKSIVDWIAWAEPQYDFNAVIDEWCKEAPMELDFNHEAENTRKVSRNLGCKKDFYDTNTPSNPVDVLIPEVILSTEKVLILEYMDGVRLNDSESLQDLGVDKQKLVEEITRAYAHQIYVDGFFNGDPHPGNFLVSKKPPHRPILLDFGLTKMLSSSMKRALAKMFLASAEGDYVALLSSFAEMGLRLRLDMPEQAMEMATLFFRSSTPANEALKLKILLQVDAFPGDTIIFSRVINLLRGLSSTMNVRVVYVDIMRPFAESVLQCNINKGPSFNAHWVHDTPVLSNVEAKLRQLLIDLGNADKILGIQVCAYRDGEVIIDTAAGTLGRYDPRPVQPDSLFPVFSVSKGITAGMVHWLVNNGKLKLEDKVANIWQEFGTSGKDQIKVHHVLNHTSGLHNALASLTRENPLLMTDWDECLNCIAKAEPETEPGQQQLYHYLSFGWLCGGIIERASGKKFQEILEEAFIHPLDIEGELYIGIPPGVESRLASLTVDMEDMKKISGIGKRSDLPSTFQTQEISQMLVPLHATMQHLWMEVQFPLHILLLPNPMSPHIPKFPSHKTSKKQKGSKHVQKTDSSTGVDYIRVPSDISCSSSNTLTRGGHGNGPKSGKLFSNPRIHDEFMGVREYENLTLPSGEFGLGFKKSYSNDGDLIGFGHSGMGGSTGYCNIEHRFAIAVTLNKMNFGGVTAKIIQLVCSELNIPLPADINRHAESLTNDGSNIGKPMIN
ncbi:ABC1 family protein [Abeliophyllum distichum]|uniref:ABC1 family protein n=1 Tax=Abeliophyllum distichum TaxID=126358 RepID=A0ABD1TYD4_9LAMI